MKSPVSRLGDKDRNKKKGIELIASCEVENRRASLATNPLRVFSAGLLFNSLTPLTRQVFLGEGQKHNDREPQEHACKAF